jgi:hypothetical protein
MPSSTSNSEYPLVDPAPPDRPLPVVQWGVAGITTIVIFLVAMGVWEAHWRNWGARPTYRNSEGLWAIQRRAVKPDSTVLVGSSRTLSDINLNVWEKLDGRRPIQLALEGTSPLTPLEGLANDPEFKGRVMIGVTPLLFFSGFQYREDVLNYYPKETPSQKFGQWLSMKFLEPNLAFYDADFALFTVLKRQPWPRRQGVRKDSDVRRLFTSSADRDMRMWEKVEKDIAYQNLCKEIWREFWDPPDPKMMALGPMLRAKQMERAPAAVKKLMARGVKVVFVLHPVDGQFRQVEFMINPRTDTWEPLLANTGAPGIHFTDYPQLQGYWLPEWSHMAAKEAERYTEALYPLVKAKWEAQEKQ